MSRILARALVVPLLLALSACGDDGPESATDTPDEQGPAEMIATQSDGTETTLGQITAECVPSGYDPDVQIVRVLADTDDSRLIAEVVPEDVAGGKTFELPVDNGDQETGPADVLVFVALKPDIETSSAEEESTGTVEVVRASCDPVEVKLTIDGTLGSEFSDGEQLDVKGRVVFPAPAG